MRNKLASVLLWLALVMQEPSHLSAQDKVILVPRKPGAGKTEMTGKIIDFNGQSLKLRLATGRERTIVTENVQDIEFEHHQNHTAGNQLFEQGRYAQAMKEYQRAMRGETRDWVRRRILSQIVWCHRYLEDPERAGSIFLLIARNDPTVQYLGCIPLAWMAEEISPSLQKKAQQWFEAPGSPLTNLLGASWLLSTDKRPAAVKRLEQLSLDSDRRLAQLANAQRWRTQLTSVDEEQIDRWQKSIRQMPQQLQAGPWLLVGRALARQNKPTQAALAFLHIPILHAQEKKLASEALLASSIELEKINKPEQTRQLLKELLDNYPNTPASQEARKQLGRLNQRK